MPVLDRHSHVMKNPFALIAAALALGATPAERPARSYDSSHRPSGIPRAERERRKAKAKAAKASRKRNR